MRSDESLQLRRRLGCAELVPAAHAWRHIASGRIISQFDAVCRPLSAASMAWVHQDDAVLICRRWRCIAWLALKSDVSNNVLTSILTKYWSSRNPAATLAYTVVQSV